MPVKARGWCDKHYDRWKTHGDVEFSLWEIDMDTPTTVYRLFDSDWTLLYVGISVRPAKRMSEHSRSKEWWPLVEHFLFTECDTRRDALELEEGMIRNEQPIFNIVHAQSDEDLAI
jgi:predicted GIY-YIG superfamily endonuclease